MRRRRLRDAGVTPGVVTAPEDHDAWVIPDRSQLAQGQGARGGIVTRVRCHSPKWSNAIYSILCCIGFKLAQHGLRGSQPEDLFFLFW